jgi:hypothetical protein
MVDVQHRVHRRQRRRATAMVGALALVVAGAAGVLATRHDRTPLAITAGDGTAFPATPTTVACVEVVPTTVSATTAAPTIFIEATTTVDPRLVTGFCPPPVADQWRCRVPVSSTPDGWTYYQYCEQLFSNVPPTISPTTAPGSDQPNTSTFDPALYPTTTAYGPLGIQQSTDLPSTTSTP